MKNKINIGITFSESDYTKSSFFSNGIMQNVVSLRELFKKCKNVKNSYIINTSNVKSDIKNTSWEKYASHIISKEEAKQKCDLIVVCQGSLTIQEYSEYVNAGKTITKQILGAERHIFNERILFDIPAGRIYKRNKYVTAIWASPHFYERDQGFLQTIYGCEVHSAPYIWNPAFIENHINIFKKENPSWQGKYTPSGEVQKRLSTMESNINLVKTSTTPIIIAELLERKSPEVLKFISIFGGNYIKSKPDMIDFVKDLDVNKNKKCFFEARYPVVWTLKEHTDIVLSHQNQCELNYLYLDAVWMGYPVVHNSPMMKELGWYYPENDAETAIKHIEYIAKNFDTNDYVDDKYLIKSREYASQFLPDNPKNIEGYEKLIEMALKKKS